MLENFARTYQEDPRDRAGAIHPSSLKGCHRQAVWQYPGVEPDREHTEEELRVFAAGYMIEDFAIRALEHDGTLIVASLPVTAYYDDIKVEGVIDAVLRVDGGWSICDIKSANSWGLKPSDIVVDEDDILD